MELGLKRKRFENCDTQRASVRTSYSAFRAFCASVMVMLIVFTLVFTGSSTFARADDPSALTDNVTDSQKILADSKMQIGDAIVAARAKTGLNIYVVFVSAFEGADTDENGDGAIDANDWVEKTAKLSHLGDDDVVFAVAITKHEMVIWASSTKYLNNRIREVVSNTVMPFLKQGQWNQAVLKFVESASTQVESSGNVGPYVLVALLLIALIIFLVWSANKRQTDLKNIPVTGFEEAISGQQQALTPSGQFPVISSQYLPNVGQNAAIQTGVNQFAPINPNSPYSNYNSQFNQGQGNGNNFQQGQDFQQSSDYQEAMSSQFSRLGNAISKFRQGTGFHEQPASATELFTQYHAQSAVAHNSISSQNSGNTSTNDNTNARNNIDRLYEQYGITPMNGKSNKGSGVDNEGIYGDYYDRSASRETYGSYYSENKAEQHDDALNQLRRQTFSDIEQTYAIPQTTENKPNSKPSKKEDTSEDLIKKYYKEDQKGIRGRFNF